MFSVSSILIFVIYLLLRGYMQYRAITVLSRIKYITDHIIPRFSCLLYDNIFKGIHDM